MNGNCQVCGKRVSDRDAESVPYDGWMCAPCFEEYDSNFDIQTGFVAGGES